MHSIFCFGELLLRLSPTLQREWITEANTAIYLGGAELNVATALANWNLPVRYCTALPDHYLSSEIIDELQIKHLDTAAILRRGKRIGTYYLPQGADLKNAGVIYDRASSSFSELQPGMIDWDTAFEGCGWFHFSAINPAVNENLVHVCLEALDYAKQKGMKISVDLNYRSKLWQYGKQPPEIMPDLVKYCDVIMGNMWSAEQLLGIESPVKSSEGKSKEELITAAAESMGEVQKQYPGATTLAYTFRLEDEYWAILQHDGQNEISSTYSINNIVDKAGSGDCFMAGLIYGLTKGEKPDHIVNFAAAAATGKLYEKGDATNQTIQQVTNRMM